MLLPFLASLVIILLIPASALLMTMFMLGNIFRESKVVERLNHAAQNERRQKDQQGSRATEAQFRHFVPGSRKAPLSFTLYLSKTLHLYLHYTRSFVSCLQLSENLFLLCIVPVQPENRQGEGEAAESQRPFSLLHKH
jgi:hypothetical protein